MHRNSIGELERLSGRKINDIHREFIDDIVICRDGKEYRRVEEVLDCWFESGRLPTPRTIGRSVKASLGLVWIACMFRGQEEAYEGELSGTLHSGGSYLTRGWFYTLHVISSLLFDQPAFSNVIVNGIVLAEDGRKMSKRLNNYPDRCTYLIHMGPTLSGLSDIEPCC